MTAYSAIANSEIAVGAPLTNSLMTKVRDNPLAIQENDVTAPTIAYATLAGTANAAATDAIVQGSIKTTLATTAGSVPASSGTVMITLNDYSFFPMIHTAGNVYLRGHSTDGSGGASPRFGFINPTAGAITYDVDHRYIAT